MSGFLKSIAAGAQLISTSEQPWNLDGGHPEPNSLQKKIRELEDRVQHGLPVDLSALPAFWDMRHMATVGINDRKYLLESILTLMARGDDSIYSAKIQEFVINLLYQNLPHPPSGYLGLPAISSKPAPPEPLPIATYRSSRINYAFRSADGSNYNPLLPTFGQAGTPYARSVPSSNMTPHKSFPDANLVFNALLRRDSKKFNPHPDGISSLFFAFANLVIHSIFHTDPKDPSINAASSYLDLSILYGSSVEDLELVRRKDGTGRLWDDVFADKRLLSMPPSTGVLLVLFNRNHNYVAQKLLEINERGVYKNPIHKEDSDFLAQDDEIFHRARLVNCGLFMQIILGDYVGAILGLVRDGLSWRLNPLETIRSPTREITPQGQGNVVSVEFNLLYRWHACTSEQDAKWTNDQFVKHGIKTSSRAEFFRTAQKQFDTIPKDPRKWSFGNLKRNDDKDGRFDDGGLAEILQNATSWSAGAFQARGTPEVLRIVEILGIEQSRQWGTCSLNEFRKFMGLKPHGSFKEWNPDEKIHTAAEALYGDIDNLELYVGMQAEEAKTPAPGAGLCPGYTISWAILADAVALTRGDRFLTVDFTPFNLTSWGYQDCQYNKDDGSFGGMLTKLLFRTLPNHYPIGSAYAHFPFLVPELFEKRLHKDKHIPVGDYTWNRPIPPQEPALVSSYEDVSKVLNDKQTFRSPYDHNITKITNRVTLYKQIVQKLLYSEQEISLWKHCFLYRTSMLIKDKSVEHVGSSIRYVDIVKDVINLLPVYWIADEIVGLEIKTKANPHGFYRDQDLYKKFADVGSYVFMNSDPSQDWTLHKSARDTTEEITKRIIGHFERLSGSILSRSGFLDTLAGFWAGHTASDKFLSQVLQARRTHPPEEMAASLFAEVVPSAAAYSKAVAHIVDFYLDDQKARERIAQLSSERTPESEKEILKYVREALRLRPPVSAVARTAHFDTELSGGRKIHKDQQVVADVGAANQDKIFGPHPEVPVYNRTPVELYGIMGIGQHGLLSSRFFESTITPVLGAIFRLDQLQRASGESGKFNEFTQKSPNGVLERLYINSRGEVTPWPASLVVQYTFPSK